MNIGFANDHAGTMHKQILLKYFEEGGNNCMDLGTNTTNSVDYPEFAHQLAMLIASGIANIGFAFCGTGNGVAMTLNRHPQIRAGIAWNADIARLIKQHNNANVCVIPARFVCQQQMLVIADAFVNTIFEGGRHQRRVEMIEKA
jgi:ribose 5-phosphate isomerase B